MGKRAAMVGAEFDYFIGIQGRNRNIARSGTGWRRKIGLWRWDRFYKNDVWGAGGGVKCGLNIFYLTR